MTRFLTLLAILMALFSGATAHAETSTLYVDSGDPAFPTLPEPTNTFAIVDAPDGLGATLTSGAFVAFQTETLFTNFGLDLEVLGVSGAGVVRVFAGLTDNSADGFGALQAAFAFVGTGGNTINSAALSTFCAGLGGCDTYIIQPLFGTTITVDSVSFNGVVASNPEPSTWAFMILAFAGVAARLKAMRSVKARALRFSPAFT
ncbi:MAG: hypothetical protein AAGD92_00780 [Pseudomonadota bacterium]